MADIADFELSAGALAARPTTTVEAPSTADDDAEDVVRPDPEEQRRALSPTERLALLIRWADSESTPNIAKELSDRELDEIGIQVVEEYDIDEKSRSRWKERSQHAIELANYVVKAKTTPWPNASNVNYPLIMIAALQFNARAYPAIVAERSVVRGVVIGDDNGVPVIDPTTGTQAAGLDGKPAWQEAPGDRRKRADRIAEHMSWQKIDEQPEWEEETDQLTLLLPISGHAFRKTYFNKKQRRNADRLVLAENLCVNYWAKSLETAPRISERIEKYPYEITSDIRAGLFIQHDYGAPTAGEKADQADPFAPHLFIEQHRRIDLDKDGYPEPYIVTVHYDTRKVARISAGYDEETLVADRGTMQVVEIEPVPLYTSYRFLPSSDGGFYGVGFGQLLGGKGGLADAINATLNQMFDAGTLANLGGGFIGKNLSMGTGAVKFKMGEYIPVNAFGQSIKDSIVPMQFAGPSDVLFKLLGLLIEAGNDVASIKDVLTGDQTASNVPATTILAIIEQGLKVFTAIYKRIHRSLKSEFDKDFRLNRLYLDDQMSFEVGEKKYTIRRDDYRAGVGIKPVSDPKMVSDMQKLGRAEFLKTFAGDPHINQVELRRRLLDAAQIPDPQNLIVENPPPDPELMFKAAQAELQMIQVKAKALADMALAYKTLAEGDLAAQQVGITFVQTQLDVLRTRMEVLSSQTGGEGGGGAAGAGGKWPDPPAVRGVAPASGNGRVPQISQRPGGSDQPRPSA